MDLTPEGRFSYAPAEAETYCINTVYFMHGPMMKRLAAFLNSSIITWYVNKTAVTSGEGTPRWIKVVVETIPIPPGLNNLKKIEQLVDDLMLAIEEGLAKQAEEVNYAIEHLICDAYGITESERSAISSNMIR